MVDEFHLPMHFHRAVEGEHIQSTHSHVLKFAFKTFL
jgi:hypothetical protein